MELAFKRACFWLKRYGGPIRRFQDGGVCILPLPGAERQDVHVTWTSNNLIRVEAYKIKRYTLRGQVLRVPLVLHELIEPPKGANRDTVKVCCIDGILFLAHTSAKHERAEESAGSR